MDMTACTALQRVLHLPELLDIILGYLEEADLARMARLATFVHHASIKLLWSGRGFLVNQHSWDHLTRLFPPGLTKKRHSDKRWVFTRPPENQDWSRFKHYSVHTTHINIDSCRFSREYFGFFKDRSDDLFPRMRFLGFEWSTEASYYKKCEWLHLAGPSLRRLWVGQPWNDEAPPLEKQSLDSFLNLLKQLPSRTPHLTSIAFPCFSGGKLSVASTRSLVKLLSSALQSLQGLEDISWLWSGLPDNLVQTIATHPSLTGVGLVKAPQRVPTSSLPLFPALASLNFRRGTATAFASLLGCLSRPDRLTNITSMVDITDTTNEVLSFTSALSTLGQAVNLTQLEIMLDGYTARLGWAPFRPLLQCRSMVEFAVYTNSYVGTGDEVLMEVTKSWPDLESFGITEDFIKEGEVEPLATLLGLVHLAKNSPKLTSISLSVSLQVEDGGAVTPEFIDELLESESPSSSKVTTLDFSYSRFDADDDGNLNLLEPRVVAHLIQKLFPAVEPDNLQFSWDDEPLEEERWGYVTEFLEEMAEAKKAEDRRLKESELHKAEIVSLIRERDQLADECARLQRALEDRDRASQKG